ncbi:MAG TPA: 4Fe-4S ferredoxin [Anaerolineae bacterium]|nr:4Fe-4S ferredoxin [Anaerolineae bacterium]
MPDNLEQAYRQLASRLNELPNGFPPAPDGAELRLLAYLFTPEEAALVAQLRMTLETPAEIAARIGGDVPALRKQLKSMVTRGLITAGRAPTGGLGYGLLPFVVGIYEMQAGRIDAELARLFEDYYQQTYRQSIPQQPLAHRVIPIKESIRQNLEFHPFESASDIILNAKAWGVTDCICRKQQALLGHGCDHPLDVCMIFSDVPGFFDQKQGIRALTQDEALATLQRAAEAGLVHSTSNTQAGLWYLCNCCTCACGFLRSVSELGTANVVARSAFVCVVDEALCAGCRDCEDRCSFNALTVENIAKVDALRCAGCGVCIPACSTDALRLVRRSEEEILIPPQTEEDWRHLRADARGIDLEVVQ